MFKNALHVPTSPQDTHEGLTDSKLKEIIADQELVLQLRRYFLLLKTFSDQMLQGYRVSEAASTYA